MPILLTPPMSRRAFLTASALGLTAVATKVTFAAGTNDTFHLALLSDTHVPGDRQDGARGFNPWENLKGIVPKIVEAKPDGVIVNGDAARLAGKPEDYAELSTLLEPVREIAPVYVGLGNHDDRDQFLASVPESTGVQAPVDGRHVTIIEHPSVRIVVLDSLLYVNKVQGLLGKAQRDWLSSYLGTASDRPAVLFVHHTLGDGDNDLLDSDRLFTLLAPHKHVKAIFYGHSHRWNIGEREGIRLINLPAVGYNFSDDQPVGWVESHFDPNGVDLTLRAFGGNTADNGKTTRVTWS